MGEIFCSNEDGFGMNRSFSPSANQNETDAWFSGNDGCVDNSSEDTDLPVGHILQEKALLETSPAMAIVYIVFVATALLIGSFGNTMIIIVTICFRSIRRTGYQFILNLAVADLCVAAIADPMCIIAVLKGEIWFNDKPWLCDTIAALCLTACFCAFHSLTLASLNRYVFVCHNLLYDRVFTKYTCAAMCAGAWIVAFLFEFPNFVGWGQHSFDKKSHQCIWDRTESLSYTLLVSIGLIGFPLFMMATFFIAIFRKIYSTKLNLYALDCNDVQSSMKAWRETIKSSKMLFAIFVLFVVLWTPYAVVISADITDTMPVSLHLFVTLLAHLHSSINFIVYVICNRKFRQASLRVLSCQKCIASSVVFSDNRQNTPKITSITGTNGQFKGTFDNDRQTVSSPSVSFEK